MKSTETFNSGKGLSYSKAWVSTPSERCCSRISQNLIPRNQRAETLGQIMNSLIQWEKAVNIKPPFWWVSTSLQSVVYVKAAAPVGRKEPESLHLEPGLKYKWSLVSTIFKPNLFGWGF